MKRIQSVLLMVAAALTFTACAPVAQVIVDAIESGDGATLAYVEQGLRFDPGPVPALDVIVRADGGNLAILDVPAGATCEITGVQVDCRLGDLSEAVTIGLTGDGVLANATYRRSGSNTIYMTFAQLPSSPEGGQ